MVITSSSAVMAFSIFSKSRFHDAFFVRISCSKVTFFAFSSSSESRMVPSMSLCSVSTVISNHYWHLIWSMIAEWSPAGLWAIPH